MAVPIDDGASAGTHLVLGEEETGLRELGALRLGRFFRAANFSILKVYSLSRNRSTLNVFN
jgi:hypothetical protein